MNQSLNQNQEPEHRSRFKVRGRFAYDRRHVYVSRPPHVFILTTKGRAPTLTRNFLPASASASLRYRPSPTRQQWRSSVLRAGGGAGNSGQKR